MNTTWVASLGRFSTGLNLSVSFINKNGHAVGTTNAIELGNGRYMITTKVPHDAAAIVVTDTDRDAVVQAGSIEEILRRPPAARRTTHGRNGPKIYRG